MDTTKAKIVELDYVELTEQVDNWPAGTRGTVVYDHGEVKMIEISDDWGQALDIFDLPEDKLKLIKHYPSKLPPDADPDL